MLTRNIKQNLQQYIRVANYLSVAQIFLQDNFLLNKPLNTADIKPRLLGHWGTCPGINVIYAHLSLLVKQQQINNSLFILGSGHGYPALQANLFLEETLLETHHQATLDAQGIGYVAKNFSWPRGFASHSNPEVNGIISEGGELGYGLSIAYGSVLDNPDLITFCLIGDGEAETAPMAGAWHLNKLVSQPQNGVVLPILHLNDGKISMPTIYGRMSNQELIAYFYGMNYQPMIVDYGDDNDDLLHQTLENAYQRILQIKNGESKDGRLPMIIFRSKKGLTGVKNLNNQKIEGTFRAHQVVLEKAKTDSNQLKLLEDWLKSYRFEELFDNKFGDFRQAILPDNGQRLGQNPIALGQTRQKLNLPQIDRLAIECKQAGEIESLSMHKAGDYLAELFRLNPTNYRLFSPDETTSNRLQAVFEHTKRAWNLPIHDYDDNLAVDGRVMEILSEHELQGLYQGYNLTGRYGAMTSYEAFMAIPQTMIDQYAKFIKQSTQNPRRKPLAPMVYLLTSNGWRQDHNGFSHQNPSFIANLLRQQSGSTVYFPADQNSILATLDYVYQTENSINAIVAGKQKQLLWRTLSEAKEDIKQGANIWQFISDEDPDLIIAAAGDYVAKEAIWALKLLKNELPNLRLRFVYISSLTSGAIGDDQNRLTLADFEAKFTADKPIIFNFHGFSDTLKGILYNYTDQKRASVHGYIEKGSTTTPFDMMVLNETSRWHLLLEALEKLSPYLVPNKEFIQQKYQQKLAEHQTQITKYGVDLDETK